MRDGQERRPATDGLEPPACAAVKQEPGRTVTAHDFDIAPEHALRVPRAERLHGRLFRRKAAGEMNRRHAPPLAIRDFAFGEDAVQEAVAVACNGCGNTRDVRGVETETDDVGHASPA